MANTMSKAMKEAGAVAPEQRLYTKAVVHLQATGMNREWALKAFMPEVLTDAELLVELIGELRLQRWALDYLEVRAADMKNGLKLPGERGRITGDAHLVAAPLPDTDSRGQLSCDAQTSTAPAGRNGKGQTRSDTHAAPAKPVPAREPSKAAREAMVKVRKMTALDTVTISGIGGQKIPVGDIPVAALNAKGMKKYQNARENAYEAELLAALDYYAKRQAHIPRDAVVRDIMDADVIESAAAEAEKVANFRSQITNVKEIEQAAHG